MEDEHQSTLKKKIQILFQLGKWPDVVKLSNSYAEQYGKDMEIDMLRFKSERHMGIPASTPAPQAEKSPASDQPPPSRDATMVSSPMPTVVTTASDELSPDPTSKESFESEAPEEIIIDDPFADDELVITDPQADDGPGFTLAPEQPPVDLSGIGAETEAAAAETGLEMEKPAVFSPAPEAEEKEPDFSSFGAMAIDAEPELVPSRTPPQPAESIFPAREAPPLEDSSRSSSGRVDVIEEADESKVIAGDRFEPEEPPLRPFLVSRDADGKKLGLKGILTPKRMLLVAGPLLAAAILWLVLSGRLGFLGAKKPDAAPEPAARPPAARRIRPAKKTIPPEKTPEMNEQEKVFDEKFKQATDLFKRKDMLKAWAVLLEAKKIKVTEPLRQLEEQLSKEIRAAGEQEKKESQKVVSQWQMENDAFAKAEADNTVAAWKEFIKAYPNGELALRAGRKVALIEKKVQEEAQQQFMLKIQQAQKIRLRTSYLGMNQADITALARQGGRPPSRFEAHEHGGTTVRLDYSTGLMWNLWNKPMAYDKAKWWANRITAGYGGWRLPTTEEALSLLQADRGQYSGLADFAVWTGDTLSDQPRKVWVLRIPEGQFIAVRYDQSFYVWSVRQAGK
jgi:hypothetical protein